jgi:hypothetical protein
MLSYSDLLGVKQTDPGFKAVQNFNSRKVQMPRSLNSTILQAMASKTVKGTMTPSTKKAILALAALRSKKAGTFVGPLNRIRSIYGLPEGEGTEASW